MKNSRMSDVEDMVKIRTIPGDSYWSNVTKGIKFGTGLSDVWRLDSIYSYLDSGSSYISIPED